jgi:hypothetical protein
MALTHSILNDSNTKQYSILTPQEQYWSTYTKSSPIHRSWTLIEPAVLNNSQPRSVIYTNNALIPPSSITPIALPFGDTTAIALNIGNSKLSLFINIYNPCDKSNLSNLYHYAQANIKKEDYYLIILAGDFNTHHPL